LPAPDRLCSSAPSPRARQRERDRDAT